MCNILHVPIIPQRSLLAVRKGKRKIRKQEVTEFRGPCSVRSSPGATSETDLLLHQYGENFCLSGFFIPLAEDEILAVYDANAAAA